MEAGGKCLKPKVIEESERAEESIACGDTANLAIYAPEKLQEQLEFLRTMQIVGVGAEEVVVGENWIVNTSRLDDLENYFGGELVSLTE